MIIFYIIPLLFSFVLPQYFFFQETSTISIDIWTRKYARVLYIPPFLFDGEYNYTTLGKSSKLFSQNKWCYWDCVKQELFYLWEMTVQTFFESLLAMYMRLKLLVSFDIGILYLRFYCKEIIINTEALWAVEFINL